MMKPDFNAISKAELRAYVIAHPKDKEVFEIFVDRFTADAPSETFEIPKSQADMEAVESLIQQRVQGLKQQ